MPPNVAFKVKKKPEEKYHEFKIKNITASKYVSYSRKVSQRMGRAKVFILSHRGQVIRF